jgi:hypothetical protein
MRIRTRRSLRDGQMAGSVKLRRSARLKSEWQLWAGPVQEMGQKNQDTWDALHV